MTQPKIVLSVAIILALGAAFLAPLDAGVLHGVVLGGTGALLILFKPCHPLPRMALVAGIVLLLLCLAAFLPVSWFGVPEWRAKLTSSGVIDLGALVTPQPLHTVAGCFLLAASVGTGLFLLSQPVDTVSRAWLASAFALGVGLYAVTGFYSESSGWIYPGTEAFRDFGFFPNKNHTANFLMLGGFASLGAMAEWLKRRRFWECGLVALAGIATTTALVTQCNSRAGTLLFGLGVLAWLIWISFWDLDRRVLVGSWIAIIVVATILFASDSAARDRIETLAGHVVSGSGTDTSPAGMPVPMAAPDQAGSTYDTLDFRILIWRDTFNMIRAQPWTGVGLGNFRYVFPQFRHSSRTESLCLHPESSLLQLAAEAGLPALGALIWLIVAIWAGARSDLSSQESLVRSALAMGAAMFLLHCCVDVPGTRVGTLWPALVVTALALSPDGLRSKQSPDNPKGAGFICMGVLMCCAGLWLVSGGLRQTPGSGPAAGFAMQEQIFNLNQAGDQDEALGLASEAIRSSPLEPEFYFQCATLELQFPNTGKFADSLYQAERLIEPIKTQTPLRQAGYWLKVDPTKCLPLFADALHRASLLPLSTNRTAPEDVYQQALTMTSGKSAFREPLHTLAAGAPDLLILWLKAGAPEKANFEVSEILKADPTLSHWSDGERRALLRIWIEHGGRSQVLSAVSATPQWDAAGWPFLAAGAANQGAFQNGCSIIFNHLQCPAEPGPADGANNEDTGLLRSRFEDRPTPASAEALARSYYRDEDFDAVLRLADDVQQANVSSPAVSALAYHAAARQGHWDIAWKWADDFVRQTDPSAAPE